MNLRDGFLYKLIIAVFFIIFFSFIGYFYYLFYYIFLFSIYIKIFFFIYSYRNLDTNQYYSEWKFKDIKDLPIYTILVPLLKEKESTINNLLLSLKNLDYECEKLDILILIEEEDYMTQKNIKSVNIDLKYRIIIIPRGEIKTKPRACNYGLKEAKGEFLVIYDAEDKPERYQLRKSLQKFKDLSKEYVCLQASLNYYNKKENFITKSFFIEYSMWFDFTMKTISKFNLFFPLGGTSNHFKVQVLRELNGWDSRNVTEDAEIAVRIIKKGYKISCINSITNEESPITVKNWLHQRTRWIKGFMQTFITHCCSIGLYKNISLGNYLIFVVFIGVSFLFFTLYPFILIYELLNYENIAIPYFLKINFLILYSSLYAIYIGICIKYKEKVNWMYFACFPFYWLLHFVAAFRAVFQLFFRPFHWNKTSHGESNI